MYKTITAPERKKLNAELDDIKTRLEQIYVKQEIVSLPDDQKEEARLHQKYNAIYDRLCAAKGGKR